MMYHEPEVCPTCERRYEGVMFARGLAMGKTEAFEEDTILIAEAPHAIAKLIERLKHSGRLPAVCKGAECDLELTQGECPIDERPCPYQAWRKEAKDELATA